MRVTTQANTLAALARAKGARARESAALERVSSGSKLGRPSANPTGAASAERSRSVLARLESRVGLAKGAESQLAVQDGALQSASAIIGRIHQLVVQGGSDTANASDRQSIAEELSGLRDALLAVANTEVDGHYVFAGNRADRPAFDASGAYQGDAQIRSIELAPGQRVEINVTGAEAFLGGSGGVDLFAAIDATVTALGANDGVAVRDRVDDFLSGVDQIGRLQARIGGRLASVAHLRERSEDDRLRETEVFAGWNDADLAEAASALSAAQLGVQAALAATARIGQLSLLDVL